MGRRRRRRPNPMRSAPPTTNFTATIQRVTSRPVWDWSVDDPGGIGAVVVDGHPAADRRLDLAGLAVLPGADGLPVMGGERQYPPTRCGDHHCVGRHSPSPQIGVVPLERDHPGGGPQPQHDEHNPAEHHPPGGRAGELEAGHDRDPRSGRGRRRRSGEHPPRVVAGPGLGIREHLVEPARGS